MFGTAPIIPFWRGSSTSPKLLSCSINALPGWKLFEKRGRELPSQLRQLAVHQVADEPCCRLPTAWRKELLCMAAVHNKQDFTPWTDRPCPPHTQYVSKSASLQRVRPILVSCFRLCGCCTRGMPDQSVSSSPTACYALLKAASERFRSLSLVRVFVNENMQEVRSFVHSFIDFQSIIQ